MRIRRLRSPRSSRRELNPFRSVACCATRVPPARSNRSQSYAEDGRIPFSAQRSSPPLLAVSGFVAGSTCGMEPPIASCIVPSLVEIRQGTMIRTLGLHVGITRLETTRSLEIRVDAARGLTAFPLSPDHERLPAPAVSCCKHSRLARRKLPSVRAHVPAPIEFD